MNYYKLIFILFIFNACDVSLLSDADTKNISKIKVNILIKESSKNNLLQQIKVNLTDGKKQIINEKIKILLNGKPLELFVRQGNYYDKHSSYSTNDLLRSESYYFEIILPDSTKYPLAFLKPLKKSDSAVFSIPENWDRNEDIILKWENINTPTKLEVLKFEQLKKGVTKHLVGNYAETRIMDTINSKSGKYVIPKSFFKDSLTVAKYLMVTLKNQQKGLINSKLLINSSITYNYTIEEKIYLKEELAK